MREESLVAIGRALLNTGYCFHTPTPLTHARVIERQGDKGDVLQRFFGWNKPVALAELPPSYHAWLDDAELFTRETNGLVRARFRFSRLGPLILAHSSFPTEDTQAVFFGPDTYRFVHALRELGQRLPGFRPQTCVDIGTGSGAGGLSAATIFPSLSIIGLLDVNARALNFASLNARLNGIAAARVLHSDVLDGWQQPADLIISNPPYLIDRARRAYRHGGGSWGQELAVRILKAALVKVSSNGHLLLYTGATIVDGRDTFLESALPTLKACTKGYAYDEIDPDVFGEELENAPYDQVDRIATVVLHVRGSDIIR